MRTGCTCRTTNGRVTKSKANDDARALVGEVDAQGLFGPYTVSRREAGNDRGQRERQVDESVESVRPGSLSRTRTPRDRGAPITMLIAATEQTTRRW
jgi:hypothetical protein